MWVMNKPINPEPGASAPARQDQHVRTLSARELQEIPNIGPAIARKLERLDITCVADLRGRDGTELSIASARWTPAATIPACWTRSCAVDYAGGAPPRPWWEYNRERKARAQG